MNEPDFLLKAIEDISHDCRVTIYGLKDAIDSGNVDQIKELKATLNKELNYLIELYEH